MKQKMVFSSIIFSIFMLNGSQAVHISTDLGNGKRQINKIKIHDGRIFLAWIIIENNKTIVKVKQECNAGNCKIVLGKKRKNSFFMLPDDIKKEYIESLENDDFLRLRALFSKQEWEDIEKKLSQLHNKNKDTKKSLSVEHKKQ